MYTISQFSKISGLTTKALRYYDAQNILKPSNRSKDTLYRYYDDSDLKKAQLVKLLRSLDFSISEIKETLDMVESEVDLTYILNEKVANIEENILREKALIRKINEQLLPDMIGEEQQEYQISIEEVPAVLVASIRFFGKYDEIDCYASNMYKAVKNNGNGALINCYYDEECVEPADMELCLPVKKKISNNAVECKYLPAVKAVCVMHYGSYERLNLAYKAGFKYVNEQNITLITPSREIYMKGPGMIFKGNPQNYVTKILLPFEMVSGERK